MTSPKSAQTPPATVPDSVTRIDSWKEIASYLKRGVRTVQRWEREEALPVHRLLHDKLGSVYAYKSELDAWWNSRKDELENGTPPPQATHSIAVLPFSDLSRDKDQDYFCEGMAEELITALNRVAGLRVASRTSAFKYRDGGLDARTIGRQLRVTALVEGSVRKAGDRLRVSAQLTDTENGYQIWAETYDREMGDVFAIQEQIARNIAAGLEVTLSPRENAALVTPPTTSVQAYDYYLRGRTHYYGYSAHDMESAIQLFSRAVELDPLFPLAYAGLADCWSYLYLYADRVEALRDQAEWASQRAVELNPESAQAQASRALALSLSRRDDEEAEKAFEKAIHLDPNLFEAYYFYARHCCALNQTERALALFESAIRVRPEDFQSPLLMAQIYDDLGRHEDAASARRRGIALVGEHLKFAPEDARAVYMAANGMAALGQRENARAWAERARSMCPDDSMLLYNLGCIYSLIGDCEEAFDALEHAVRQGLRQKGWFEYDSNLDPLRANPRFQALLRSLD